MAERRRPLFRGRTWGPSFGCWPVGVETQGQRMKSTDFHAKEFGLHFEGKGHLLKNFKWKWLQDEICNLERSSAADWGAGVCG